jgi:hypothetical protein
MLVLPPVLRIGFIMQEIKDPFHHAGTTDNWQQSSLLRPHFGQPDTQDMTPSPPET